MANVYLADVCACVGPEQRHVAGVEEFNALDRVDVKWRATLVEDERQFYW